MSHIWQSTITITPDLAKELIESQTALKVCSISLLGEGFDNVAYLINDAFVFRFPRREMGVECMENEILILPFLRTQLSFPFSCPEYIGTATQKFPAPFAGYSLLRGTPLSDTKPELINDKQCAEQVADWLKQLHSIPVLEEHRKKIRGDHTWRWNVQEKITKSKLRIQQYRNYLEDAGFNISQLLKSADILQKIQLDQVKTNCYVHGDLYSRHVLVDNFSKPCGIIDWGDIHTGHPGNDLSLGMMIFSQEALEIFFKRYGNVDQQTRDITLVRVFSHSIILLAYCCENGQDNLKQWTILALQPALQRIQN